MEDRGVKIKEYKKVCNGWMFKKAMSATGKSEYMRITKDLKDNLGIDIELEFDEVEISYK